MLLLITCGLTLAASWTVDPAGTGDFQDLPSAVAAADAGDVLVLSAGTYPSVFLGGKDLTLYAATPGTVTLGGVETAGADVVIQGVRFVDAIEPVVVVGGAMSLSNVEILGGSGEFAVRISDGATVAMREVQIEGVTSILAPVVVQNASLTMVDSRVGQGLGDAAGAILGEDARIDIRGSSFANNTGIAGGGAVSLSLGTLSIATTDFSGNLGVEGGAVRVEDARAQITDSTFSEDVADLGGHLFVRSAETTLARVWMTGGMAERGAGIAVHNATLSATNVVLFQGEAVDVGGGLFLDGGTADIRYAVIADNFAGIGGGVAVDEGSARFEGVIFAGNAGEIANASAIPVTAFASLFPPSADSSGDVRYDQQVLWGDPGFMGPHEFILTTLSPALDAGPGRLDPDGTEDDMGAFGGPEAWPLPDQDGDGEVVGRDCNDTDPSVSLRGIEVWYDGIDQNCAGDGDFDQDGDGWSAETFGGDDCVDTDASVNPGADERPGDAADTDCDGWTDADVDGDGWPAGVDCNDSVATTYPGAGDAWYDGVDENCDGGSDFDADRDGFDRGDADCDDTDPLVYAGAPDVAGDGLDQDCDGGDLVVSEESQAAVVAGAAPPSEDEPVAMVTTVGCSSAGEFAAQGLTALIAVLALTGRRR